MKKNVICWFVCLSFGFFHLSYAQDWVKDLKKMNGKFTDKESFSMKLSVRCYEKIASPKPIMSYSGMVAKTGDNYFSELMNKVTLINEKYYVVIDKGNSYMMLRENIKKKKPSPMKNPGGVLMNIDSIMMANATGSYISNNAKEKRILLLMKNSDYSKMEVTLDPVKYNLTQVVFYLNTKNPGVGGTEKIIVDYSDIKTDEFVSPSIFSEKQFFSKKGDKYVGVGAYKNYEIIDESKPIND